ncbi:hypothetical protein [Phytomonospora endophytica]|uniref:Uncharacterized protein n=1 Tax=Phytomonospora endophytica TaxID=714109 RepID=A0A841FSN3_9ACTN|nr:hypothetical protein [Phytomonospora endophytica]MBB6034990.1 hypothetical protein [Phytomonospora endophytica]GIG71431.1 hypothetical protein Pen01_77260 [Phytomonospora endophytica]
MPSKPAAPLPVTFDVPARHRFRRAVATWIFAVLGLAWIALAAVAVFAGIGPDPLSLLPAAGLLFVTVGAALVVPRLRPARVSPLRVEAARLVAETPRGTRKFPARKVTAALTREGADLVLTLDDTERRRPTRPVRVVLARHDTTDPAELARLTALARVLAGSPDQRTRRTAEALSGEAPAVTLAT